MNLRLLGQDKHIVSDLCRLTLRSMGRSDDLIDENNIRVSHCILRRLVAIVTLPQNIICLTKRLASYRATVGIAIACVGSHGEVLDLNAADTAKQTAERNYE